MQPSLIGGKGEVSLAQHVKDSLSLNRIFEKMNLSHLSANHGDKYVFWECPFHECPQPAEVSALKVNGNGANWNRVAAQHPLRVVSANQTFECAACGRSGDSLDFYAELKGFANSTLAAVHLLNHSPEIPKNWKTTARGGSYRPSPESEAGWLYLKPPETGRLDWAAIKNGMDSLYHSHMESAEKARSLVAFAKRKRWMTDEIAANPYPVGIGPEMTLTNGSEPCATLQFPKMVLTEQSARFYQLEQSSGALVGVKYRLSPEGEKVLNGSRSKNVSPWTFSPNYPQSMAWEFDANEDASCLFVTVGPGSGVALYHEAWHNQETIDRYGSKWHIMGFDSFFNLSSLSLVRRVVDGQTLSLFDRYRHIWLVVGAQGLNAREERFARLGASIIKGHNAAASVSLLKLNTESVDSFFEEGGRLSDFAHLAKIAETI